MSLEYAAEAPSEPLFGGGEGSLLASLLGDDAYVPPEPTTFEETGLSPVLIEALALKYLLQVGSSTGRAIAQTLGLPFGLLEDLLLSLRKRQLVMHQGQSQVSDYLYALTDLGGERARVAMRSCAYVGAAPVPLEDYLLSVEAQTIRAESARRPQLERAFADIHVEAGMLAKLGPAINSGTGLFLYGAPGNGKTTFARRITKCFGQSIWIPRTICEDGQFIKFFDAAFHEPLDQSEAGLIRAGGYDRRWVKIRRPTVVVGGELTMDSLELRHDPNSNVCEASLQLKSNCGCLLIDDFGRQRIEPGELLNRWIIPLENRHDYLTLPTGKKIQVPFDQLIIFSTNLEPSSLADDAFLRRIPYKVEVGDPGVEEFRKLFRAACDAMQCPYEDEAVNYLVERHYRPFRRPLRRCQPRDLLLQVRSYCVYNDQPPQLTPDILDAVASSYFTAVAGSAAPPVNESLTADVA